MQYNVFESKVLKDIKRVRKDEIHGRCPKGTVKGIFRELMRRAIKEKDNKTAGDILILNMYTSNAIDHIFIENEKLYKLLEESPIKEKIQIDTLIEELRLQNQYNKIIGEEDGEENNQEDLYGMIIHALDSKSAIAVAILDSRNGDSGSIKMYISRSGIVVALGTTYHTREDAIEVTAEKVKEDSNIEKAVQTVHNLSMYLKAYNGTVRDGVPEGQPRKYEKKEGRTIGVSEEIKEHLREITPHMRRGYFKKLTSEYFKHKRGQIIYIKATFVRGKAKTVETEVER